VTIALLHNNDLWSFSRHPIPRLSIERVWVQILLPVSWLDLAAS
jgi:hypothetical protein